MKNSSSFFTRTSFTLSLACLAAGLVVAACDLDDKDLGNDPVGTTGDQGTCEPGDTKMEDCNTCSCEDGLWACTEIGCGNDDSGSGGSGNGDSSSGDDPDCDPEDDPSDECNSCSCDAGLWSCTAQACADPEVGVCDGTEPLDALFVLDASVAGDQLLLSVEYSGGCAEHVVGTCWDETFAESEPVQASVTITHDANGDKCEAIEGQELSISLLPLRNAWVDAYMQASGTITLNIAGWGAIDYSF